MDYSIPTNLIKDKMDKFLKRNKLPKLTQRDRSSE